MRNRRRVLLFLTRFLHLHRSRRLPLIIFNRLIITILSLFKRLRAHFWLRSFLPRFGRSPRFRRKPWMLDKFILHIFFECRFQKRLPLIARFLLPNLRLHLIQTLHLLLDLIVALLQQFERAVAHRRGRLLQRKILRHGIALLGRTPQLAFMRPRLATQVLGYD